MKKLLFAFIAGVLCLFVAWQICNHKEIRGVVTALKFNGQEEIFFKKCRFEKTITRPDFFAENFWYQLKLYEGKNTRYYYFNDSTCLLEPKDGCYYKPSFQTKKMIDESIGILEKNNPFGCLEEWNVVNEIFPRMSKGVIRDLETGLCFHVQRRAGRMHADVQPLTKEDTAVYKSIYSGSWSWKRRAAILEKDNKKIAASIHGMPHGKGAINGNNFPGHFCMHFLNSSTHSSNIDLAHQLMVWKAAGKLEYYLRKMNNEEMIRTAFTAIAQNDPYLVVSCFKIEEDLTQLIRNMKTIANLKVINIKKNEKNNAYNVFIEWYKYGKTKKNKAKLIVKVEPDNRIDLIQVEEF